LARHGLQTWMDEDGILSLFHPDVGAAGRSC
jgi:hypothetical protein